MEVKKITDHRSYKISDQKVIERVLNGEKELYEILLRRYNQTLYRTLRIYLYDETEIEDLLQEIWLKTWENLHKFRHEASFSTWLVRIGINETLIQIRKKKKNFYPLKKYAEHEQFDRLKDTHQMNPENRIIRRETRRLLEQAVGRLPQNYRSVYMLREVEGMDTGETAACLKISKSNVKVRLHRARILLRDILLDLTDSTSAFEFGNNRCDDLVDKVMNRIFYC